MAGSRSGKRRRKVKNKLKYSLKKAIRMSDDKDSDFKLVETRVLAKVYMTGTQRTKGPEVSIRKVKFRDKLATYSQDTAMHKHKTLISKADYEKHLERQKNKTDNKPNKSVMKQSQPANRVKPVNSNKRKSKQPDKKTA